MECTLLCFSGECDVIKEYSKFSSANKSKSFLESFGKSYAENSGIYHKQLNFKISVFSMKLVLALTALHKVYNYDLNFKIGS